VCDPKVCGIYVVRAAAKAPDYYTRPGPDTSGLRASNLSIELVIIMFAGVRLPVYKYGI
jgi:hypothetical protein